jgi:hypothetical protein
MDFEPDYAAHTLDKLLDAASHIDRETYSERARRLDDEIGRRFPDVSRKAAPVGNTAANRSITAPKKSRMKIYLKHAFETHLQHSYSLRLHMCAILLATTLSGILFSKGLLLSGVTNFTARYPLAVILSYLIFFGCIRLWLSCISSTKESKTSAADWIDLPTPSFPQGIGKIAPIMRGGGGQFSGAGASGSFDSPDVALMQGAAVQDSFADSGSTSSDGISDAVGGVADAFGDDNIVVAAIVLAVLVATILVSAVFVIYGAPAILAEAAFQGVLAASLIRKTRSISNTAWAGSIVKATWKPFALTLAVALFGGAVLHSYYPHAVRLADILLKG